MLNKASSLELPIIVSRELLELPDFYISLHSYDKNYLYKYALQTCPRFEVIKIYGGGVSLTEPQLF